MQPSRIQIIIIGAGGVLLLLAIGVLTGILPGLRQNTEKPPEISLTIWGVIDRFAFEDNFTSFTNTYPNVSIDYQ